MDGMHLSVVQSCANGSDTEFIGTLCCFLENHSPGDGASFDMVSVGSADVVVTSVARDGPPAVERLDGTPVLFVLSSPRSGSSLLQLCLQVNNALYAGQELHLLPFATMHERRMLCPFELLEGLVKTVADVWWCDAGCSAGDAGDWVASQEEQSVPIWSIFKQLLNGLGRTRTLVDKSPSYVDHPCYLAHAHVLFGSAARYIHLVRHPYACIEGGVELMTKLTINDAFNPRRGGNPADAWPFMEGGWTAAQKHANDFLARVCCTPVAGVQPGAEHVDDHVASVSMPRALRVFYEDLLRTPAEVMEQICEMLNVAYVPDMIAPYDTAAIQTFRSVHSVSTTDPKLLRRKKIESSQADKWRRVQLPQPLSEEAKALAVGYGYSLE
jgi:hypothetical protein